MRVRKARTGTASRVVPVSTMAWHPEEQATGNPPMETLGTRMQGEPGLPKTPAGGQGILGIPLHGDLPVGFGRERDPGDASGGVVGIDGTKKDKAPTLAVPGKGESIRGGSQPNNTPIPIRKREERGRNPQQLCLGFTCSGRQRKDPYPRGFASSCCRRQGWLRRRRCLGMPIPGCRQRGCSRRNPLAPSPPAQKSGCGR